MELFFVIAVRFEPSFIFSHVIVSLEITNPGLVQTLKEATEEAKIIVIFLQ